MVDTRVAKRYAQALFESAKAKGIVAEVESDFHLISDTLHSDASFREFLYSPQYGREDKQTLLTAVFGKNVNVLTLELTKLMLSKQRETDIPGVASEFTRLRRDSEKIVHAVVTSTEVLTADQKAALVSRLQSQTGKSIEAEYKVDPTFIGGIKVSYDDFVLDGTVKGSLSKLREHLRHDLLKQA